MPQAHDGPVSGISLHATGIIIVPYITVIMEAPVV